MKNENILVLIVDDDETFRGVLKKELSDMGFIVICSEDAERALETLHTSRPDVVVLDIKMPGLQGDDAISQIKQLCPLSEIIILTGFATIENAIKCMKLGAYDYLTKPCNLEEVEMIIKRAVEKKNIISENIFLKKELGRAVVFSQIVGDSREMKEVRELIDKVALTDSTVLLEGESGTGKELIARSIHNRSLRKDKPFIVVDCTSLHENLLLSELFGHEKGAFTGAFEMKRGLFEIADKGTLFLDEIGDISSALQSKLLRFLETSTFRRVGGIKDIRVDIRIIAATNKSLKVMVQKGLFREDLFYRLNVFSIKLPPLREHKEDIPILVNYFLNNNNLPLSRGKRISKDSMDLLCRYHWPGNVRELQNVIERALILSQNVDIILPEHLPQELKFPPQHFFNDKGTLEEIEKNYIERVLIENNWNKRKASRILNISERNLYRLIKRFNLKDSPF